MGNSSSNIQTTRSSSMGELSYSEMGKVLKVGHCSELRRSEASDIVAKCIRLSLLQESLSSVRKDIKLWSQLRHQNLVQCLGYSENSEYICMRLEHCAEGSLKDRIQRKHYSVPELQPVATQVLEALEYLHNRKIVYGILKPNHVLFRAGQAVLADFATRECELKSLDQFLYYFAPETVDGDATPSGDIWALGVTLYFAATGKLPFNGIALEDVTRKIKLEQPNWELLDTNLRGFLQCLLQKRPEDRPTATEALNHSFLSAGQTAM